MNARPRTDREALDDAAFDRLVHTHRASLERFTQQLGASREDAEEIAATALLRAYQSPPGRLGVDWRPWLRTVARNLWIDMRRRRAVHLVPDEGTLERVPSAAQTVDQIAATAEEARAICAAIALLPAPQRAAIYLREVRGLSYDEIAAELGITLAAVTSNLHRARQSVSLGRGALRSALGLAFAPFFLLRRAAGVARLAGTSGVAAKAVLPIAFAATLGGATAVVQELRTPMPHPAAKAAPRLAATVSGRSPSAPRASQPTPSGRVPARIEHPGGAPSAGYASPALASAGAGSSVLAPWSATPPTTNVSDAATPATAGTAPPASPPATGSATPSAPPTVAGGPAPAQVPPADTRKAKAPAVSPGRSASAPGRSSSGSGTAQSSRASATGQQHRATGNGSGNGNGNGNGNAAKASATSRQAGSQAATKATGNASKAAANATNAPVTSPSPSRSAATHATPGPSESKPAATTPANSAAAASPGHAMLPASPPAAGTATNAPVAAPANASAPDPGSAADSPGQGTASAPAGAAGPPADAAPPANDAHPTGPAHATGPPSKANAATP